MTAKSETAPGTAPGADAPVDWERAHRQSRDALLAIYVEACRIHAEAKAEGNAGTSP